MQDISKKYTIKKIEGTFAIDNIGSRRVMEKLGMTFDRDTEYSKFDNSATFKAKIFSKIFFWNTSTVLIIPFDSLLKIC